MKFALILIMMSCIPQFLQEIPAEKLIFFP